MYKYIKAHLKSNIGDGYVLFLCFIVFFIILFCVLFNVFAIKIMTTSIYNEIENSVDVVISEMKNESYQELINGHTNDSVLPYGTSENDRNRRILSNMAALLSDDSRNVMGGDCDKTVITATDQYYEKYNYSQQLQYKIYDIHSDYNSETGDIRITFSIDIPIRISGKQIFIDTETFTKNTVFSFKDNN